MIDSLIKMYKKGAITGYQVMIDCLFSLDPKDPGLVLGRLPDKILEEMLEYAHRYDPERFLPTSPTPPAEDRVRAAESWIVANKLANPKAPTR